MRWWPLLLLAATVTSVLLVVGGYQWREAERDSVTLINAWNDRVSVWNSGAEEEFRARWYAVRGRNMSSFTPPPAASGYLFAQYQAYQREMLNVAWANVSVTNPPASVEVELLSADGVVAVEAPAYTLGPGMVSSLCHFP
jgi:hypothetical protein